MPDVDDRLFELMLAPLGDDFTLREFVARAIALQTTGAQNPETLGVATRWLARRGHAPVAPPIDLGDPDVWDGGHASGGNAVHQLIAHVWSADPALAEEAAAGLFGRMWAPDVVRAICAKLPFEEALDLSDASAQRRLFRQGRLVVTHTGKPGKKGRVAVKLHADAKKAQKDAAKRAQKMRQELEEARG